MLYPVELSLDEISLIRQSLDIITISGKSAKFVASLQEKLDESSFQLQMNIQFQEQRKQQELEELTKPKKPTKSST